MQIDLFLSFVIKSITFLTKGLFLKEPFNLLIRIVPTKAHIFLFVPKTSARPISIMGNFNDWSRTSDLLSDDDGDGIFETTLHLEPEMYEYKFVIGDSDMLDPENEDIVSNNMGGWNSVLDLTDFKKKPSGQWVKKTQKGSYLAFTFLTSDKSLPVKTSEPGFQSPKILSKTDTQNTTQMSNQLKNTILIFSRRSIWLVITSRLGKKKHWVDVRCADCEHPSAT